MTHGIDTLALPWLSVTALLPSVHHPGRYPVIPCLLSVCFDDAKHVKYTHFYVNKGISVDLFIYKTSSISPMHHKSKQRRQKAWDDGVALSDHSNQRISLILATYSFSMNHLLQIVISFLSIPICFSVT